MAWTDEFMSVSAADLFAPELEVAYGQKTEMEKIGDARLEELLTPTALRLAQQFGVLLPLVALRADPAVSEYAYEIRVRGYTLAQGQLRPGHVLVWNPEDSRNEGGLSSDLMKLLSLAQGTHEPDNEPVTGKPAVWIEAVFLPNVAEMGYRADTDTTVLLNHLAAVLEKNVALLVTRAQTRALLEQYGTKDARLAEEASNRNYLSLGVLHRVLRELLEERVPIRDFATILETVLAHEGTAEERLEQVRKELRRTITKAHLGEASCVWVFTLDANVQNRLQEALRVDEQKQRRFLMSGGQAEKLLAQIEVAYATCVSNDPGRRPVLLVRDSLRRPLAQLLRQRVPGLPVVAATELMSDTDVKQVACITLEQEATV